jgi:transcriptional regulator with XRE-family HTH domain
MPKKYAHIDFQGLKAIRLQTIDPNTLQPLRQQDLAKIAGMKQEHYSKIETGNITSPADHYIAGIAKALQTNVSDLLNNLPRKDPNRKPVSREVILTAVHDPIHIPKYSMICNLPDFQYGDGVIAQRRETIVAPPTVENASGAFALQVVNLDSAPKYMKGDTVYVNPDLTPTFGDDIVVELHYSDATILLIRRVVNIEEKVYDTDDSVTFVYHLSKIIEYTGWMFDKAIFENKDEQKISIKNAIDLFPANIDLLNPPDKTWRKAQYESTTSGFPERINYHVIVTADNGRYGLTEGRLQQEREERLKQGIGSLLTPESLTLNVQVGSPEMTVHRGDKTQS